MHNIRAAQLLPMAGFVAAGLVASPALADSSVYVTNNTPKEVTIKVTSTLSSKYWDKKATTIPPFSRREIFETNRDKGVKNGKNYVFTAEVIAKDLTQNQVLSQPMDNFELKLRLRGSTVGSHMWQSHRKQNGSHGSWHDDRQKYSTSMSVAGRPWGVKYWAYGTGGDDDVEFVLRENYKNPEGHGISMGNEWKSAHLNVLNYNVYLRPTSLFHNGQTKRAAMIPKHLGGYDVVVFQEAFDDDARAILINGMKKKGYPYASKILGKDEGTEQDGGVIIVSRYPIVAQAQRVFKDCSGSDCLADKGVIYAKINKKVAGKNNFFHVFGTHLNDGNVAIQNKQMATIRKFVDSRPIGESQGVVIAGDMNINMHNTARFNQMLSRLNARYFSGSKLRGHKRTGKRTTYDGAVNDLGEGSTSYYDYVLVSKSGAPLKSASFVETRVPRATMEWKQYAHESAMWDLSDHYAVYANLHFDTTLSWDPYAGTDPNAPGTPVKYCNQHSECESGYICVKNSTGAPPSSGSGSRARSKRRMQRHRVTSKRGGPEGAPMPMGKASKSPMTKVPTTSKGKTKPATPSKKVVGVGKAGPRKMYSGTCRIKPPS